MIKLSLVWNVYSVFSLVSNTSKPTFECFVIVKISMTSPIVINMPTRELLASETKNSFV